MASSFNLAEQSQHFTKILVIKLRGIGDVVLTTAAIDNLRAAFPIVQIDFLTEAPSKEFISRVGGIEDVIVLDKSSPVKTILDIRRRHYDIVLDFFSNPRTSIITLFSGAKHRVGFAHKSRTYAYNHLASLPSGMVHHVDFNLGLLRCLDIPVKTRTLHFPVLKSESEKASRLITDSFQTKRRVLALVPSGGWPSKRCDPDKMAEFGMAVANQFQMNILIVAGKVDRDDAEQISNILAKAGYVHHLVPEMTLTELGALFKQCDLVLANDCGPMHVSAAVGSRTLGIFGPTPIAYYQPFSRLGAVVHKAELDCIECQLTVCPRHHECFRELDATLVVKAAENLLEKS
jgi:ADP-heptose:LPS heptosyltransferase